MKLNFKISELLYSKIAIENKISNIPDLSSLDNLLNLIVYCLQPIRNYIGKPIIITSGFRSKKLNLLVNGSSNSQHKTGQAVDFVIKDLPVSAVLDLVIKSGVEFDQLINEYDKWVHLSYVHGKNKKQIIHLKKPH